MERKHLKKLKKSFYPPTDVNLEITSFKCNTDLIAFLVKEGIDVMEGEARDTFPSGHVMIAAMSIVACFRYRLWKVAMISIPFSMGVIWSTLYLRYHYLVDGLVGIALVLLITWLGGLWFRRAEKKS